MNRVFFALVAIAFCVATCDQLFGFGLSEDPMTTLGSGAMDGAKSSVDLAISLIGNMALFLGLMKVGEAAGLMTVIAKLLRPVMVRLFPAVPANHPAMGAMILNMSANALGLANAATPFGIRAMQELDKLNPQKGTATNAMVMFLAINTSSVTLLPTGVIVVRDALNSADPAGIMGPTLFATVCSTCTAIVAVTVYKRFSPAPVPEEGWTPEASEADVEDHGAYPTWVSLLALLSVLTFIPFAIRFGPVISPWVVPLIIFGLLTYGFARGVAVYEVFIDGAKQGFEVGVMIIPYLVAILSAVGMLRASGTVDLFVRAVGPYTGALGMPPEAIPMALLRPLSGSGAYGVMMEIMNTNGPDTQVGYLVSTLQGSTETTFYVIAVYFGAVGISRIRHAMAAALTADAAGVVGATIAVSLYWQFSVMG